MPHALMRSGRSSRLYVLSFFILCPNNSAFRAIFQACASMLQPCLRRRSNSSLKESACHARQRNRFWGHRRSYASPLNTQPLNIGVFGPFKNNYNQECANHLGQNTSASIASITGKAYLRSATPSNNLSPFTRSGVYPLNP